MSRTQDDRRPARSDNETQGISRRALLQAGGAATLASAFFGASAAAQSAGESHDSDFDGLGALGASREDYWKEDGAYFVQSSVDMSDIERNIIRARVEGKWQTFAVRELDQAFYDFNMAMRVKMLKVMMGQEELGIYNDAHNAAVATYGGNRGDSRFTLNVAYKGMGWVPKPARIQERIDEYAQWYTASTMKKVPVIFEGYQDAALWDRRLQGSLELYTVPQNETHSFLNQMLNPISTLGFLGNESYEMRAIARLMHPKDPNLTDYEQNIVTWINYAHDFFHGGPDPDKLTVHNIAVAYFIVEEFDNSPWGATATAGGMKRVPRP